MKHRPIVILAVSFAVMLAAGVALAQVGAFAPSFSELSDEADTIASGSVFLPRDVETPSADLPADKKEEVAEEPPAKEAPRDVKSDKPEEPGEEPKEEPAKEPADTTPPKLTVTSPKDGAHFGEKKLTYTGMTEPGARVFAGEWEADVFESGEWHIVLILSAGKNVTTLTAKDAAGNRTKATVTAYLDVAGEPDVKFTAHQKYGTNSEPWEKFIGTAPVGTVIELGSKYGNARLVTESSEWHLKLHFDGLEGATTFPIVLHTSTGKVMDFPFTYEPKAIEFTARQKYGECSDPEPYDVFLGTARPGSAVTATTEGHGSASTVAGDLGNWDLKVFFTNTTPGEQFFVTVSDSDGHAETFKFVSYAGGDK
jgi:hypothetical protein